MFRGLDAADCAFVRKAAVAAPESCACMLRGPCGPSHVRVNVIGLRLARKRIVRSMVTPGHPPGNARRCRGMRSDDRTAATRIAVARQGVVPLG
jgi:hypothetical protein